MTAADEGQLLIEWCEACQGRGFHVHYDFAGDPEEVPCTRCQGDTLPGRVVAPDTFDPWADGEALRDEGMAKALDAVRPWDESAREWVEGLAVGSLFTSEDMTAVVGLPRVDVGKDRNNAVGACIMAASRAGLIRKAGYANAKRRESHGALLAVWERHGGGA